MENNKNKNKYARLIMPSSLTIQGIWFKEELERLEALGQKNSPYGQQLQKELQILRRGFPDRQKWQRLNQVLIHEELLPRPSAQRAQSASNRLFPRPPKPSDDQTPLKYTLQEKKTKKKQQKRQQKALKKQLQQYNQERRKYIQQQEKQQRQQQRRQREEQKLQQYQRQQQRQQRQQQRQQRRSR